MEKLYYTVGEVAAELGEQTSLVRFWSNTFSKFFWVKITGCQLISWVIC